MAIYNQQKFEVSFQPNTQDPTKTDIRIETGPKGLFSAGIVLDVSVRVDAITLQQQLPSGQILVPPAKSLIVKGLIDTGCTITSIDKTLISELGLATRGFSETLTANGAAQTTHHLISVDFPGTSLKGRPVQLVYSANLIGQPYKVLIGRDILSQWTIHYNGPTGFISISD